MKIEELISRVENGEVVILDTSLRDEGVKYDHYDSFFNWFESGTTLITDHLGREWVNRNHIPKELRKGNLIVQNDERAGVLFIFDSTKRS